MAGITERYREGSVHDGSGRIVVQGLTKQFGPITAVQNLSFTVEPGTVTGFLGPNGAGKTTTLRMMLGLVTPTSGSTAFGGSPYEQLGSPARVVGSVLEAQSFHPRRTARAHLRIYAAAIGVPDQQADQVLQLVGLGDAGGRRVGKFSMGMRQRLALATALLGDPQVLLLDEPANGLDPEGIAWLRNFLQSYARAGRTVLVSSHILAEVEQTVDQVVIISRGQCVYYGSIERLRQSQQSRVLVQPADPHKLVEALRNHGLTNIEPLPDGRWLSVIGARREQIAEIAAQAGVATYDIRDDSGGLEAMYFQLTNGQFTGGQQMHPVQQGANWPGQGPQGPSSGGWGPPADQSGYGQQQSYQGNGGFGGNS